MARLSFALTVILIPARYRFVLSTRAIPPLYPDYTDFLLFIPDVFMVLTLAFWGISKLWLPHKITAGPRHIWIPLTGLTVAAWISVPSSYDPALSIYHSIRLIALFGFYLFVINEIHTIHWILFPVGLQALSQGIVASAQFLLQHSLGLQYLGELVLNPSTAGDSILVSNGIGLLRAYGLSDHPNILGGCLAFALLILLAAYLRQTTRASALIFFIPVLPALLVTFSRSAWLAFLGGAAVLAFAELSKHGWKGAGRLAWLALASLFVLAPFFLAYAGFFGMRLGAGNSFTTPSVEQQSIGERILLVQYAAPILLAHPLTGVGLGASPLAFKAYYPHFPVAYEPPHFALFDSALETGVLGAVSYLMLMVLPVVIFIQRRKSMWANPLTVAAGALLVAVAIVGFFDYYTWMLVAGRLWQYLAWGLWAAALNQIPHSSGILNPAAF